MDSSRRFPVFNVAMNGGGRFVGSIWELKNNLCELKKKTGLYTQD